MLGWRATLCSAPSMDTLQQGLGLEQWEDGRGE